MFTIEERIPYSVYKQTPVYRYFKISQGTLKLLIVPAGKVLGGRALGTWAGGPGIASCSSTACFTMETDLELLPGDLEINCLKCSIDVSDSDFCGPL